MAFANLRVLVSEKLNNLDNEQIAYLLSFIFLLSMLPLSKITDFPVYWLSFWVMYLWLELLLNRGNREGNK